MNHQSFATNAIDRTIREFSPLKRGSFEKWDSLLEQAETKLRQSDTVADIDDLSSVCAERIRIAFESGLHDRAIEKCRIFKEEFPPSTSSFSNVSSTLILALKARGLDSQAAKEIVATAANPEIHGSDFISLLAMLPEDVDQVPAEEFLRSKLDQAALDLSSEHAPSLQLIEVSSLPLGSAARKLVKEVNRVNMELTRAILGD